MIEAPDKRINAFRPDLAAESLRGVVDAAAFVEGRQFQVSRGCLALRRAPAPDAPLDSELLFGEPVRVFDVAGGWAWLQSDIDGYVGYARLEGLSERGWVPTHRVSAVRTHLYPLPDLKAPPIDMLPQEARVTVDLNEGGWARHSGGGWIYDAHLAPIGRWESDAASVARRFMHTPYLWGGRTGLGLDCSALVQLAFAACGVALPRDSDMQAVAPGGSVDCVDDLGRGDLVFWPGHVALCADASSTGPTLVIHANATDMMVAESPLDEVVRRVQTVEGRGISALRRIPVPR